MPTRPITSIHLGKQAKTERPKSTYVFQIKTHRDLDQMLARVPAEHRAALVASLKLPFIPKPLNECKACGLVTSDENIWSRHTPHDGMTP